MKETAVRSCDLQSAYPEAVQAAQRVYDDWNQDSDGFDEMFGAGGICDAVAEEVARVLNERLGVDAFTQYVEADCHTVVLVPLADGLFVVDIPARTYETGTGYVWTKVQGVTISVDDVCLDRLTDDRSQYRFYMEMSDEAFEGPGALGV